MDARSTTKQEKTVHPGAKITTYMEKTIINKTKKATTKTQ